MILDPYSLPKCNHSRCIECGAIDPLEAEKLCRCAGEKDTCHGDWLWSANPTPTDKDMK